MNKIEQLKAALEAATPGFWDYAIQGNNLSSVYGDCGPEHDSMADADLIAFDIRNGVDAYLIALMKNNLPALLEAAEALQGAHRFLHKGGFDMTAIDNVLKKLT